MSNNLTESVKVVVRCRALSKRELEDDHNQLAVQFLPEQNQITVLNHHSQQHQQQTSRSFTFDAIYALDSTTEQIYNEVAFPIVESAFEGYNGTIFAYGQTGCGKSFTMQGDFTNNGQSPTGNQGIIQRAFEHILEAVAATKDFKFLLSTSYIEIYNDEIHDLLAAPAKTNCNGSARQTTTSVTSVSGKQSLSTNSRQNNVKLDLKRSTNNVSDNHDNFIEGLTIVNVKTLDDCLRVVKLGLKNRSVSATLMNSDSSRSHSILTVYIDRIRYIEGTNLLHKGDNMTEATKDGSDLREIQTTLTTGDTITDTKTNNVKQQQIRRGKLHLVDLAGSERLSRTGAIGDRLKEATKINLSLSALGNVISSVAINAQHVPYRDSKLTRLLQDSLGGNAKTLMIACIAPTCNDYHETLCTLAFARRAKCIKNKPVINQDAKDSILESYKNEIDRLRTLLAKLEQAATIDGNNNHSTTDRQSELNNLIQVIPSDDPMLFANAASEDPDNKQASTNVQHLDEKRLSTADALNQMRSKTLDRLNKLQSQLVGGERADDEDIKMRRRMRAKMAKRKFDALNVALAKLKDDDLKLVRAFGDISQELATKSDILRDSELRIANLEQEINELTRDYELEKSDMADKIYKQSKEIKFFKQLAQFIYNSVTSNVGIGMPSKSTREIDERNSFNFRVERHREDPFSMSSSSSPSPEVEVKDKLFKSFTRHVRSLSNWSEFEQKWLLPDAQKLQITQDNQLPETMSLGPNNGTQRSFNRDALINSTAQQQNTSADTSSRFWQKLQQRNSKESLIAYFKLNTTSHLLSDKR